MADHSRGWSRNSYGLGWSPDWANDGAFNVCVKFVEGAEEKLFDGSSYELLLHRVLPFVKELTFAKPGVFKRELILSGFDFHFEDKVFKAMKYCEPNKLVVLKVFNVNGYSSSKPPSGPPFNFEKLASIIASGVVAGLKRLELRGQSLSGQNMRIVLEALQERGVPILKHLILNHGNLKERDMRRLAMALSSGRLNSLEDLDVSHNPVLHGSVSTLTDSFQEGVVPDLKRLGLADIDMGKVGMKALARAFASGHLKSLEDLEVSSNRNISNEGTSILADAFQQGEASVVPNLKHLNLADIGLGKMGMMSLARALASGRLSSLEDLDVSSNEFLDEGTSILADAFQEGEASLVPNLQRLKLSKTGMRKMGMMSLARALASGRLSSLEDLDVSWNKNLSDEDMSILGDAFQEGDASVVPNLKHLDVEFTNMGRMSMLSLARALASGRLNSLEQLSMAPWFKLSEIDLRAVLSGILSALQVNNCLTIEIESDWDKFPDLDRRRKQLLKRNSAYVGILAGLSKSPTTQARFAKLYLCGNPEVGKTTLRNTLQGNSQKSRHWRFKTCVNKRTRGIEVTQFKCERKEPGENPIVIRVWDMAGQEDYHLVHNAFFPALISADGRATTFLIVCTTTNLKKSMQELDYWLRYIASSCDNIHDSLVQHQRHVLVVLNNIGGRRDAPRKWGAGWKKVLEDRRRTFQGFLDIQTDLFLVDVRKEREVQVLKNRLSEYSRNRLKDQEVPAICQLIQENAIEWSQGNELFPVLQWGVFVNKVREFSDYWPEEHIIEAAAKYLHEGGVLVYIHKKFPPEWEIPGRRLVVMNPNWFCNEIVGRMFLPESMLVKNEQLFSLRVHRRTGSISIIDFKRFFQTMYDTWTESNIDDLITIVLWLGLCYKGRDQNVFIPALIREHGTPGGHWTPLNLRGHQGDQWVMGFSIEHERNEVALAPMLLWHRFQVEIAQSPRFNGLVPDSDLIADKYFMTFNVDFMSVLIVCQNSLYNLTRADIYKPRHDLSSQQSDERVKSSSSQAQRAAALAATGSLQLNVVWGSPTFDEISIFVMPVKKSRDDLESTDRKQRQVDLASDLVEILLDLWNEFCPAVKYVHRVVWPWPVAQPGAEITPERNLEVTKVQQMVRQHGPGRKMQWEIGSNNWVTADQLLCKKDEESVVERVDSLGVLQQGLREAVHLGIFPPDVLSMEVCRETSASDQNVEATIEPLSPTGKLVLGLVSGVTRLEMKVDKVDKKLDKVDKKVEEGFRMVLKEQKMLLHQHLDTEEIFLQDKERTCPKYIYLGNKTSGVWTTVKSAFSETVRLHFACEEQYNSCGPHAVKNQRGLDVSELKDWVKTILPWLKVTLTVVFLSAKVAANMALPGAGLLVPGFGEWSQCQSLSDGIASATGYSIEELDKLMVEDIGLDVTSPLWDARQVYGKSREAITRLIGKRTPEAYEKDLGLRRVRLKFGEDTCSSIVWICNECFENYRKHNSSMVREIPLQM